MASTLAHETNTTPIETLEHTALEYGIALSQSRLKKLQDIASDFQQLHDAGDNDNYRDREHGISVSIPGAQILRSDYTDFKEPGTAQIDFMPLGNRSATPERTTEIIHHSIRGLQDYGLLVKAGYIERPLTLYGNTNPQMAKVAERIGFTAQGTVKNVDHPEQDAIVISAPYDKVEQQIFSEETLRLDRVLIHRLAATEAGNVALS